MGSEGQNETRIAKSFNKIGFSSKQIAILFVEFLRAHWFFTLECQQAASRWGGYCYSWVWSGGGQRKAGGGARKSWWCLRRILDIWHRWLLQRRVSRRITPKQVESTSHAPPNQIGVHTLLSSTWNSIKSYHLPSSFSRDNWQMNWTQPRSRHAGHAMALSENAPLAPQRLFQLESTPYCHF